MSALRETAFRGIANARRAIADVQRLAWIWLAHRIARKARVCPARQTPFQREARQASRAAHVGGLATAKPALVEPSGLGQVKWFALQRSTDRRLWAPFSVSSALSVALRSNQLVAGLSASLVSAGISVPGAFARTSAAHAAAWELDIGA